MTPGEPRPGWTGALLVGGRSRRMGRDKLVLRLPDGRRLVECGADALRAVCTDCVAVGEAARRLGLPGFRALDDSSLGSGPAAGLLAALAACRTPWLLLLAGDMPGVTASHLAALQREAERDPERALLGEAGGRILPLPSAWPARLADRVEAALSSGKSALREILPLELRRVWGYSNFARLGGPLRSLNHPRDWSEFLGTREPPPEPPESRRA